MANSDEDIPGLTGPEITHLRVRRKDLTVYLECGENDTVQVLKHKLERFFPQEVRLYHKGLMLDDKTTLYHQNVRNSAELFALTKGNPDGGWETLEDVGGQSEPKT